MNIIGLYSKKNNKSKKKRKAKVSYHWHEFDK